MTGTFNLTAPPGLTPNNTTRKVVTWGGFNTEPLDVWWREDCTVQVQSQLNTPADLGVFDVGLVGVDGRQVFLRAEYLPGWSNGRLRIIFDDGNEEIVAGTIASATLPSGQFWMVLRRYKRYIVGEIYTGPPWSATVTHRVEGLVPDSPSGFDVDFGVDARPRVRLTPTTTSAIKLFTGYGLLCSGRQLESSSDKYELWTYYDSEYSNEIGKRSKKIAGPPEVPEEYIFPSTGGVKAVLEGEQRVFLAGNWTVTSGGAVLLGTVPRWMRPANTINVWVPYYTPPGGGPAGLVLSIDTNLTVQLLAAPPASGQLILNGVSWSIDRQEL